MQSRAPVWLVLVKQLWFQVLIGAALGWLDPALRAQMKPFGDGFIALKGAAGVAGAAFVVLAATLSSMPAIPLSSIALILGIHRLMAEALTFVNTVGYCIATLVVSKWEGAVD